MNKTEATKKIMKLIEEKEKITNQIKKAIWEYEGEHVDNMPEFFPYKKWIREKLGIVI